MATNRLDEIMQNFCLTKQQARQYLIRYHHFTHDTQLTGDDDILAYVRKVGCIQYDPLDQVGKNADLVLQSRYPRYQKNDLEKLLYRDKRLFDVWDKNMSICGVEDWPYFSRTRAYIRPWYERFNDAIEMITDYLRKNESACSSDFALDTKVQWYFGRQRLARAALECMCYAGAAVVHHKKGTRRYYCLAEKHIQPHLFAMSDPNPTDEDYYKWLVLRRINSIGLLWNRGGDAWLGTLNFKSANRNQAFTDLLQTEKIVEFKVEGIKHPVYISRENIPLLQSVREKTLDEIPDATRILAPLDNFLWDRKLIEELFGFEYRWEVYTPAHKRKYGYYVLPVLYNDQFMGRTELRTDKTNGTLIVQGFWWEDKFKPSSAHKKSLKACLKRFAKYNRCDDVVMEVKI